MKTYKISCTYENDEGEERTVTDDVEDDNPQDAIRTFCVDHSLIDEDTEYAVTVDGVDYLVIPEHVIEFDITTAK